jgi:hypothetical protein
MNLNDAIEEYYEYGEATLGCISVHCDPAKREEIGNFLQSKFEEKWWDVVKSFADTFNDPELWLEECVEENSPLPVWVEVVPNGLHVAVGSLAVRYDCGDYYCGTGDDALEEALHDMVKAYPGVTYDGYVSYLLHDVHGGEWVWYAVRSPGNDYPAGKVHTGGFLAAATEDDYFWDLLKDRMDNLNDFEEVMGDFVNYKEWLPDEAFDKLLKLADRVDKDFRPVLEKKMTWGHEKSGCENSAE